MNGLVPVVTGADRRRLATLLNTSAGRAWGTRNTLGELEEFLEDASCVESQEVPETLVTMNTTVDLRDLDSGEWRTATLVYPQDAGDFPGDVSVTEPLGVALLGCRVDDVVHFRDESTDRRYQVAEILYQPEHAEGRLH
jgi:regulator of nucleoside diphosphate kinase